MRRHVIYGCETRFPFVFTGCSLENPTELFDFYIEHLVIYPSIVPDYQHSRRTQNVPQEILICLVCGFVLFVTKDKSDQSFVCLLFLFFLHEHKDYIVELSKA